MSGSGISQLDEIEHLIDAAAPYGDARVVCRVAAGERSFPVYAITLGNAARDVPAVGCFGGVHGLLLTALAAGAGSGTT